MKMKVLLACMCLMGLSACGAMESAPAPTGQSCDCAHHAHGAECSCEKCAQHQSESCECKKGSCPSGGHSCGA